MKSNKQLGIGILIAAFAFLAIAAFPPDWAPTQFQSIGGFFSIKSGALQTNAVVENTVTITNSSAPALILKGGQPTIAFVESGADTFSIAGSATGLEIRNSAAQLVVVVTPTKHLRTTTGITNEGWYHGTGRWTNLMDAWLITSGEENVYYNLRTDSDQPSHSGVQWQRGTTTKWKLRNDGGDVGEDLWFENQTTAKVLRLHTNGTAQAMNQFNVGSYSYTVSTNLTTPGNTATTMFSVPVPVNAAVTISALVTGSQASSANAGGYYVIATGSNNGGTTAIQSTITTVSEKETIAATVVIDFDDATDTGRVRITGVAATEIKWGAEIKVVLSE